MLIPQLSISLSLMCPMTVVVVTIQYTLVTHTIDLDPYEVPTGVIIILIIWILSQDNLSQDRAGMDRLVTGLTPIIRLFRK